MKTSIVILLSALVWTGMALQTDNLAAVYVSISAHVLFYILHALEVKVNRLLDHYGLQVTRHDVAA